MRQASRDIKVELGDRSYLIRIGRGVRPGEWLRETGARKALIVSDSNVDAIYGADMETHLRGLAMDTARCVVPPGELSKSVPMLEKIYHSALAAGLDRASAMVALGGGVVGDLAGFAAATYLRGIRLVQVPTSLLAMVDSSVGGKTGINLAEGKNLVGAFYQPSEVCADMDTLGTLPAREYVSGLAEVVKYGVIWDGMLFRRLEREAGKLLARDTDATGEIVARCCEIKAEIVGVDELEAGMRALLNFGHTLGHALEQAAGYGALLHGEAVAIGMVFAAEVSAAKRGLPAAERDRIRALIEALGLPAGVSGDSGPSWGALRGAMSADKKSRGSRPRFVLADAIGKAAFGCEVEEEILEEAYAKIVR